MSRPRLPLRRRRGGSYTVIVIASSVLILATSSVLLRATGHTFSLTALDGRRSHAREAVFSGLRWAQAHADRVGPQAAEVTLQLAQGDVEVRCEVDGQVLEVVCRTTGVDLDHTLSARLVPDEQGRYQAAGFTLEGKAHRLE